MEYHKIDTLYERDEQTHRLKYPLVLKNPAYSLLKTWQVTEKIDGTNIRCMWNPKALDCVAPVPGAGAYQVSQGALTFGGKTDNAQIHPDLIKHLHETVSAERLREVFPDTSVVLYGEGYGAGIQKGGGDYSPIKKFILFDVLVLGDAGEKWWLNWENTCDVASKLSLDVVPFIGEMTLEQLTLMVRDGFTSRQAVNTSREAEGIVARPQETLFDKRGNRLILKLKTKDFRL